MQHTTLEVSVNMPAFLIAEMPGKILLPDDHFSHTSLNTCSECSECFEQTPKLAPSSINTNIQWSELTNIEHLTRGGSSLVYSARYRGKPVVVKTMRPKIRQNSFAVSDIESELAILSRLDHTNIVSLVGSGVMNNSGVRFLIFEKLDGGTLSHRLGFDPVEGKRQPRKKKRIPYHEVLKHARSLALALRYLHEKAIPNGMVLHRDLKPDNIAFTEDGTVKLLDFGLARILHNGNPKSKEVYSMSGETGSLRYMAPEVAKMEPYNHKADVYSFGVILWEMLAGKKAFTGFRSEEDYFRFVVHHRVRPTLDEEWPIALCSLISDCWDSDLGKRPDFQQVIMRLDFLLSIENDKSVGKNTGLLRRIKGFLAKAA